MFSFSLLFIGLCGLITFPPYFLLSLTAINCNFNVQKNDTFIISHLTMEIIRITSTLLICFSLFMLSPFSFTAPLLDHEMKMTLSSSPRKLKLNEQPDVKSEEDQKHLIPFNTANLASLPGVKHEEQEPGKMVYARKGTRQEWVEGKDTSDFFTMDYHWVRRRRPIHNKSIRP